jgi:hypothetical protein
MRGLVDGVSSVDPDQSTSASHIEIRPHWLTTTFYSVGSGESDIDFRDGELWSRNEGNADS